MTPNQQTIEIIDSEGIEGMLPYQAFRARVCAHTSEKDQTLRSLRKTHTNRPGRAVKPERLEKFGNRAVPLGLICMRGGLAQNLSSVRGENA